MTYAARVTQTGDGSTLNWAFAFDGGYISRSHVKVLVTSSGGVETTPAFTFNSDYNIRISPAVANGSSLRIYRETPADEPLVNFSDGSGVSETNLDNAVRQALFVSAEAEDRFLDIAERAEAAADDIDTVAASVVAAEAAADAAAASAVSAANAVTSVTGTSSTSVALDSSGSTAFTASLGRQWSVGTWLAFTSSAEPTKYIVGAVTAYDSTTGALTVNISRTSGHTGSKTDWLISVTGIPGATGSTGATGPAGAGDVVGQVSSVDSEIALFSGTGGKTIKRASLTAMLRAVAGVLTSAVAGTDYVAPGAVTTSGLTQATDRLLGRTTASTGAPEEISVGTGLSLAAGTLTCPLVPAGTVLDYAGASTPTGFLLCDGSAVSRTTYSALFSAVGTAWGSGDGSTTFNVPDMRGRVSAGKDDMGGSTAGRITNAISGFVGTTLGASGGSQAHVLTEAEIPAHTHTYNNAGAGAALNLAAGSGVGEMSNSGSTGGGGAHRNVQPTAIFNKIIKT